MSQRGRPKYKEGEEKDPETCLFSVLYDFTEDVDKGLLLLPRVHRTLVKRRR